MAISLVEEDGKKFYDPYERPKYKTEKQVRKKYFNKIILISISALIVVASVIIFLVLKSNNTSEQSKLETDNSLKSPETFQDSQQNETPAQNTQNQNNLQQQNNVTSHTLNDDLSDFPITATPPVPLKNEPVSQKEEPKQQPVQQLTKSNNDLYKNITNDTRINGSIYSDGKNFNYQISSWKKKNVAEQEVKRLRSLGLNAFIYEVYLPKKGGTWYRVRIGSFKSEKETQDFINKNKF